MRILLAEDDSVLADGLTRSLRQSGYVTDCVNTGQAADNALSTQDFDLLILDLDLPVMSGLEVLRRLRTRESRVPVLILTARDNWSEKVAGIDAGADDYLTKPFHREELVARIHAIIRRSKGHSQSVIRTGAVNVNLDAKTVDVGGKAVHLTGKEYQMLELLSLRKGTTLTKEMFLNHLYGRIDANLP